MPEYRLPHDPAAAVEARSLAREALRGRLAGTSKDDFVLMVTELVTNAVRHAPPEPDGTIILKLEVGDDVVRG